MKKLLLILLLCSPVLAVHNAGLLTDPNGIALFKFDNGALTTDSVGTNTLTNSGVADSTDVLMEGTGSGNWIAASADVAFVTQANMDAGFPGKATTGATIFSVTGWALNNINPVSTDVIVNCWSFTPRAEAWKILVNGSQLSFSIGYASGTTEEAKLLSIRAKEMRSWFHFLCTYDITDDSYQMAAFFPGTNEEFTTSGTFTNTYDPCDAVDFGVGRYYPQNANGWSGYIDELFITDDIITLTEWRQIYKGTYGFTPAEQGNDFTTDPNALTCWGVNEIFTTDSLGFMDVNDPTELVSMGPGRLTTPLPNVGSYWIAGFYSASIQQFGETRDVFIPASFPGQTSGKDMSITTWIYYHDSLPSVIGEQQGIASYDVWKLVVGTDDKVQFLVSDGTGFDGPAFGTALVAGVKYHIGATYKHSDQTMKVRIWDDTAGDFLGVNATDTSTETMSFTGTSFYLGAEDNTTGSLGAALNETTVFIRELSNADIDGIRGGSFDMSSGAVLNHGFSF